MVTLDENFKKEIGKRLKTLRELNNFTIDHLLDELNNKFYLAIDEKTIRRYENGTYFPRIDNLIAFSELYETTLDFIVFGKETSDDNSFTFKDNFKRLNRLLYSCMLFPWKEENKESNYYGKYFFTGYDEELKLYIDRVMNYARDKKYSFEVRGRNPIFDVHDLDCLIKEFGDYKEQLAPPCAKRLDFIISKSGENSQVYFENKIQNIKKKRKK